MACHAEIQVDSMEKAELNKKNMRIVSLKTILGKSRIELKRMLFRVCRACDMRKFEHPVNIIKNGRTPYTHEL